jgi:hemerythrin-like domain-containing protein
MKATTLLIQEHKLILRALDVLDAMSASIDKTGTAEEPDVEQILDFLRWFGDAHHQAKEESVLFPALKSAAASQARPVEHMTVEHRQECALIEDLERDLRIAKLSDFTARAELLSSSLRNHIYKEDRILFETVDAVLSPPEDAELLDRLTRFDTTQDKQLLEQKLEGLRSLEWKYLRR